MKNLILIYTLLSVFFVWSCSDEVDSVEEWNSSARVWEDKVGNYRGLLEATVGDTPMDTVIQQVALVGDNYDRINLSISSVTIADQYYNYFVFSELSFKEDNGVLYIKGEENNQNQALGLISLKIEGEIKNDLFTFDLTINGLHSLDIKLSMKDGRLVEEFPSSSCYIEKVILEEEDKENSPFITGTPIINSYGHIVFFVADSLTITDSTFFSVRPISLELAPGAWIEADTTMNWKIKHSPIEDIPSTATSDSLYHFSEDELTYRIKIWAADSIRWRYCHITYAKSNATKISLFHWENSENGGYSEPIAGWASNNDYINHMLTSNTIKNPNMYVKRVLGNDIGDTGAEMKTEVIGTVADSNIRIITGKLFRGYFDLDSIDTPKRGEFHGIAFSKRKPVSLRAYYKYLPGEVLYVGDSIVPDSILNQTDSCYIEAFLYESVASGVYLDSLDYMNDPKVIGHAKFAGGKSVYYRQISMNFTVRNWIPTRRYHLGIICKSSGKDEDRIGSPGSVLSVSGFELMSTEPETQY